VKFEVVAQVKQGSSENSTLDKQKGDEKSAHPSIAIKEWMNRFKLCVGQSNLYQGRKFLRLMQELLESI